MFTLLDFQNEGAAFRWTVVSMPENFGRSVSPNKQPNAPVQGIGETTRPDPLADNVSAALDRIEIPKDVERWISELLTSGSSLIISDYGLGRETGNDTDFIVVMH